ncbi:hypothetical protein CDAR_76061, partial [Caerostris darwini]
YTCVFLGEARCIGGQVIISGPSLSSWRCEGEDANIKYDPLMIYLDALQYGQ